MRACAPNSARTHTHEHVHSMMHMHVGSSSFSGFSRLGLSFIVVCPGQPMMAEIWSAYNSSAGASHVSIGNSEGRSRATSKEVLVKVTGKDQSTARSSQVH